MGWRGGGLIRISLKKVFMDKKYINAKRILGLCMDRFFASRDLHAAEVADKVLAHVIGVPTS